MKDIRGAFDHLPPRNIATDRLRLRCFVAREPGAQRLAPHEGHHIEEQPVGITGVEQRQQVVVLQVRRGVDLALKVLGAQHGAESRIQAVECGPTGL